jgi:hypothetical protein
VVPSDCPPGLGFEIQSFASGEIKAMSTSFAETFIEVSGPESETGAAELQEHATSDDAAQVLDHGPGCELDQLCLKKRRSGYLRGRDAALYTRLSNTPAPTEKPIDIPSLQLKLSSLLPRERQLVRRTRKLAWQLSKGRRVTCEWDNVFLSELTPAENRMSDDDFLALYPDKVKTPTKKGGRPRKYRTAIARRKGHAERQRRYRERKVLVISDVTKTPSQLAER